MNDAWLARMRAAQVAILFRTVTTGVVAAMLGAAFLAAGLIALGATPAARGAPWAIAIALCAAAHITLKHLYDRATLASRTERWWRWGAVFSVICLAEGIGWGWASVALAAADRLDLQLLVMLAAYAIAAGSIPAFGSYLPAFWLIYVPTCLPFLLRMLLDGGPEQSFVAGLDVLYIAAMAGLGVRNHGELQRMLRLGFEKDDLSARLLQEKDRAEEAARAKSRFLAAASHDLRQPVHALSLFVGALRAAVMAPDAATLVGHIEASVAALDGLFSALLNISELDANVVPNRPQPFAVQPLLERICREHAEQAAAKGLHLRCHPCSLSVLADPVLLERVLRNLVSNAVRYTARGRVVIGCRRGAGLRIEVWDTGPGIQAAQQERVFEEFFQLDNPERDRTRGLGLGLAIVRRLTVLMGIPLTLRSVPGRGSVFSVTLPLAPTGPRLAPAPPEALLAPSGGALILVVDDEAAIRTAMHSLLGSWGFRVLAAGSGAELLRLVADCTIRPALLICDHRLREGEDGISVVRRLQDEYNGDLPAILITGDTAPERLLETRASGLLLLHKPLSPAALRRAIEALIDPATATDAAPAAATVSAWLAAPG
jgi:signal transduction histidine kinase/FixJ family two-component response regulator